MRLTCMFFEKMQIKRGLLFIGSPERGDNLYGSRPERADVGAPTQEGEIPDEGDKDHGNHV